MLLKIWFDIRNLRYKFPLLYVSSDFHVLVVFMEKNRPQNGQFLCTFWVVSGHFLANHFKYFDETRSEVRQNGYKADAKDQRPSYEAILEIFSLKVGKNRPKSVKIYGWFKNFSKKFFFGSNDSKWSNSKSYGKSEIWRPSIFLLPGQPGSTLGK